MFGYKSHKHVSININDLTRRLKAYYKRLFRPSTTTSNSSIAYKKEGKWVVKPQKRRGNGIKSNATIITHFWVTLKIHFSSLKKKHELCSFEQHCAPSSPGVGEEGDFRKEMLVQSKLEYCSVFGSYLDF